MINKLIAHRGIWNKYIKDNSYEAIKNGLNSCKYIGIECDIRTTKDKKFIIYHNSLHKGNLVKNTYYKDMNNISLLEDILKINTTKLLVLEIKEINIDKKKLLKILHKYKRNYYIMSFYNKVIKDLKKEDNTFKYGILNYIVNTNNYINIDFICLLGGIATSNIIESYETKGIEVIIYGTNNVKKDVKYIVDDIKLVK